MKILYYDCFCGISGDMNLGAMLDLGVSETYLREELAKLPMADEFELEVFRAQKKGIEGTKVNVHLRGAKGHDHEGHHHKHKHDHSHHQQGDHSHHQHGEHHHHDHRNLSSIEGIIDQSQLSDRVKTLSKKIFMEVAQAEAKVHGKDIQEVHFHEVGAVDSIVDIVGAAICFDALGVDQVISSSVELGGGFVKCDHGMMPVPAPATAEILKGIPVKTGLVNKEMTTPTGAAIIKALAESFSDQMSMKMVRIGYGLGTRDLEFPNVLRVMLLESADVLKKNN